MPRLGWVNAQKQNKLNVVYDIYYKFYITFYYFQFTSTYFIVYNGPKCIYYIPYYIQSLATVFLEYFFYEYKNWLVKIGMKLKLFVWNWKVNFNCILPSRNSSLYVYNF